MPIKRLDPTHPNFPHGTRQGYLDGCRATSGPPCPGTPTCSRCETIYRNGGVMRLHDVRVVREYVNSWTARGYTTAAFATAADMSKVALRSIMIGDTKEVQTRTVDRLMAVDEAALIEHSQLMPIYLVDWKVGSLAAAGHSVEDQAKLLGCHADSLLDVAAGRVETVRRHFYEEINILFDRLEYTMGNSAQARAMAKKRGYQTPDKYTPNGLLWEEMEDELEEESDEAMDALIAMRDHIASQRLEVIRLAVRKRFTIPQICAEMPDLTHHAVVRYRADSGVRFSPYIRNQTHAGVESGQEAHIKEILSVLNQWDIDMDNPHRYAVELGMMTAPEYDYENRYKRKSRAA